MDRRQRRELRERYESLDPFALKRALERGLRPILAGSWWKEPHAEAMPGLRVARADNLWHTYWNLPSLALN